MRPRGWELGKPLRVWLKPSHGASLKACGYQIIWATAWELEANEWIGPEIGLPELESVDWGPVAEYDESKPEKKLFYKTRRIAEYMNENHKGIPFIWVDDEAKGRDLDYLRDYCPVDVDILQVNPKKGLDENDFETLKKWKDEHSG
jgi:hypothetical protein